MSLFKDQFPELVTDEARIARKKRVFQEVTAEDHLLDMLSFTGIGGPQFPASRQSQTDVPHQCDPDLRYLRLRF